MTNNKNITHEVRETKILDKTDTTITYKVAQLPDLCQHIIYKFLHKMYMSELCNQIIYNISWVRLRSGNIYRYQFLTSIQTKYPVWNE
jgi:hypothetical protein